MGTKHSQQRCVHDYSTEGDQVRNTVTGMDYAYTVNVTESQYGSWTKLSLTDSTVQSDNIQEQAGSPGNGTEEVGVTTFLTQPPSEQQDTILREVAETLMATEPDVSVHSNQEHTTSFSHPKPPQTPQPKPALHYSLSLTCQTDEGTKKEAIAGALFDHFEALVEQVEKVEPEDVANKLYGIAVLDSCEVDKASEGVEPRNKRARSLMQLIKRKLWKNPGWFVDVCKILRACGVKAVSQVIDDVQKKCPSEEVSILSSGSPSAVPSKASVLRRQTSCQGTFTKLEESFKASGLQGATEYVRQLSAEQPALGLIHEACLGGVDVSTLDLLLSVLAEKNHDINSKSECGQTPLHIACAGLEPSAESAALVNVEQRLKIEHLLSHNARNWIKDKDGNTPLHLAVLRADNEIVTTLLKSGKRCLNVVNKRGNSALHLACKLGLVDIMKTLCDFNADTSLQNKKMRTALHLACIHEHSLLSFELASHDPSTLDAFDNHRMTPLHITTKQGNDQLALSLLKLKNCSPNKMDEDDRTPLHYACECGSLVVAAAILEKNSSKGFVGMQDRYGDTALHIASRHGYTELVKELLSHRANKDIVNQEGKTPMDIAIEGEHNTIATKMMRKRGWNQRRKSLRKVRKLRRTLTQSSLASSIYQSEMSEILENSSDESGDDETIGMCVPNVTKMVIREN